MAYISKIKLPNGSIYDIKDSNAPVVDGTGVESNTTTVPTTAQVKSYVDAKIIGGATGSAAIVKATVQLSDISATSWSFNAIGITANMVLIEYQVSDINAITETLVITTGANTISITGAIASSISLNLIFGVNEAQIINDLKLQMVQGKQDVIQDLETIRANASDTLKAYPVGSIYLSVNSTSPASLFGGTWEQLKDRFLLGAGSSYTNATTGGAAQHTLTVSQLPTHNHYENFPVTISGNVVSRPGGVLAAGQGTGSTAITDGTYKVMSGITFNGGASTSQKIYPIVTNSSGGGAAHNNMPPYLVVYMWKRVS